MNIKKHITLENVLLGGNIVAELKSLGKSGDMESQLKEINKKLERGEIPESLKASIEKLTNTIQKVEASGFDDEQYNRTASLLFPEDGPEYNYYNQGRLYILNHFGARAHRNFILSMATEGDNALRSAKILRMINESMVASTEDPEKFVFCAKNFAEDALANGDLTDPSTFKELLFDTSERLLKLAGLAPKSPLEKKKEAEKEKGPEKDDIPWEERLDKKAQQKLKESRSKLKKTQDRRDTLREENLANRPVQAERTNFLARLILGKNTKFVKPTKGEKS